MVGGWATAILPAAAARERVRRVSLYCPETDERFVGVYWRDGVYLPASMRRIDWLMRDFHRDVVAAIDPALVDLLRRIALAVERRQVSILSGYRTHWTNVMLRREGMPAAPHSQHLVARAADIAIDGVAAFHIRRVALRLRRGGVGYYDDFVHVDTGPVRRWVDGCDCRPGRAVSRVARAHRRG